MKIFAFILVLTLPAALSARPYSETMADCAALYQNSAGNVSPQNSKRLLRAANVWITAAMQQKRVEGRELNEHQMLERISKKTKIWEAKGQGFFLTQEFRDWTNYCRAFAQFRGIHLGE